MENVHITADEISKLLCKLKTNKSPGPDNIHPKFLKLFAEPLGTPLAKLFNNSIRQEELSQGWKNGRITAIFKRANAKKNRKLPTYKFNKYRMQNNGDTNQG